MNEHEFTVIDGSAGCLIGIVWDWNFPAQVWKKLYLTYTRPQLEFAIGAWSPNRLGLIGELEKMQRRATKVPFALSSQPYEDRLSALGLERLELWRDRGDLIQFFEFYRGLEIIS